MSAEIVKASPGWLCVTSTLKHLTVTTYAVDPARLRALIPPEFELELIELDEPRALVSAVSFLNTEFGLVRVPGPKQSMGQTNYRVYIKRGPKRAVWFLGTTIDTPFVLVPRLLWRMPWQRGRYRFDTQASDGGYDKFRIEVQGAWPMRLEVEDLKAPIGALPGFRDASEAMDVLTQPYVGFYGRKGRGIGRYTIWHDRYEATEGRVQEASFGLLERLDVVSKNEQLHPHSVIVVPETLYWIYLPPRRWSAALTAKLS